MNDVFKPTGRSTSTTRTSLFKLSQVFRKTNHGQNHLLTYVAPSAWNELLDFLKTIENVYTYKQRVKSSFFYRLNNKKTIFIATSN